jgi:N-acetylmuramoyl-L-alanine amidase
MSSMASRLLSFLLVALGSLSVHGAEAAARAAPLRPAAATPVEGVDSAPGAPLASRKIGGIDYVNLIEGAGRLDLKATWIVRGRRMMLTAPSVRADLENDTREITVNGLRVFLGDPVLDVGSQFYVSRVDFERCLTPLLRPGYITSVRPTLKTIVLDPGHGGKDNGTSAKEKVYALDIARRAKKELEAKGYRVVLTRDSDVFLDLSERAAIANENQASLFASIHFNAIANDRRTSGVEIFTFAPQYQRSTNSWSPGQSGDVEKEASRVNRYDHWSVVLAQAIQRRFVVDLRTFDRGKKIAHWGVLRQLNCPGVLLECGFLTSDAEARKIATSAYRQKLAVALAAGIRDYAATLEAARARASAAKVNSKKRPRKSSL